MGSFAQILVTGFFGVLGLIFYLQHIEGSNFLYILLFSSIVISALMFYLLFNLGILIRVCDFLPFLKKIKIYINVVQRFEKGVLWRLIGYATCRYLIYSLQFYLLLRITHNYFLPIEVFSGIWLNFWVIAVVPSFVIADIGVRGKTAVEFLGFCSSNVF